MLYEQFREKNNSSMYGMFWGIAFLITIYGHVRANRCLLEGWLPGNRTDLARTGANFQSSFKADKIFHDKLNKSMVWLQFGPDGVYGQEINVANGIIPWKEVQDMSLLNDGNLMIHLYAGSPCIPSSQSANADAYQITVLLSDIYESDAILVFRDLLRAFEHYSDAEAAKEVPDRIHKLLFE